MTRICIECGNRCDTSECERCAGTAIDADVLGDLAHRLWMHWSQHIALDEPISDERVERWKRLWTDYSELDADQQATDKELVEEMLRNKRHPEDKWNGG